MTVRQQHSSFLLFFYIEIHSIGSDVHSSQKDQRGLEAAFWGTEVFADYLFYFKELMVVASFAARVWNFVKFLTSKVTRLSALFSFGVVASKLSGRQ